jgi:glycosyltransferase involved in cell wall biosynthesis
MGVSLVIPAKNERHTILDVVQGAQRHVDEIIVIDGHSTDGTADLARSLGAKVFLDSGAGKGAAIRLGLAKAREPITVFMDADGSHSPADIPRLLHALEGEQLDLVIGSRIRGGSDEWSGSFGRFVRMFGSHVILLAINYRWGIRLTDCQNGFRAIRTEAGRKIGLNENGFAIEQEMVMKCLIHGLRVGETGCHEYERKTGESKLNLFKVSPAILRTVVVLSLSRAKDERPDR